MFELLLPCLLVLLMCAYSNTIPRLSSLIGPNIALDKLVRRNAFARHVAQEEALLSVDAKRYLQSYADGVNAYAATHARPWPFWLVGYKPTEWTVRPQCFMS